jgi:hypothetical protein
MNITLDVSFPNLLNEYLEDNCVKSQLLDLVLNSDVETKLSSNFNIWINKKYSHSNQILSLAEVNKVDQVLVYFEYPPIPLKSIIKKITLIEYGHTLNKHEKGKLHTTIVEKVLSDLYKMFNDNPKIQNVFNRFCKNGLDLINAEIEIYHISLISELKDNSSNNLNLTSIDKLYKYRKIWLSYKSDVENHNPDNYYSNLNNLPLKLGNNISNFPIYKNVELRKDDVYLNIILNKIINNYIFNNLFKANPDKKNKNDKPYLINIGTNEIEIKNVQSNKGNNYQLKMDFSLDINENNVKYWIDEMSIKDYKKNENNTILAEDKKIKIIDQIIGLP